MQDRAAAVGSGGGHIAAAAAAAAAVLFLYQNKISSSKGNIFTRILVKKVKHLESKLAVCRLQKGSKIFVHDVIGYVYMNTKNPIII